MFKKKAAEKSKAEMKVHVTAELQRVLNVCCCEQYGWLRKAGWGEQDMRAMECEALQTLLTERQMQRGGT